MIGVEYPFGEYIEMAANEVANINPRAINRILLGDFQVLAASLVLKVSLRSNLQLKRPAIKYYVLKIKRTPSYVLTYSLSDSFIIHLCCGASW